MPSFVLPIYSTNLAKWLSSEWMKIWWVKLHSLPENCDGYQERDCPKQVLHSLFLIEGKQFRIFHPLESRQASLGLLCLLKLPWIACDKKKPRFDYWVWTRWSPGFWLCGFWLYGFCWGFTDFHFIIYQPSPLSTLQIWPLENYGICVSPIFFFLLSWPTLIIHLSSQVRLLWLSMILYS